MSRLWGPPEELNVALSEAAAFAEWFRGKAVAEPAFAELVISRTMKTIQRDRRSLLTALRERGWSARDYVIWTASRETHALVLALKHCPPCSTKALLRLFELCLTELLRSGFITRKELEEEKSALTQVNP